MKKIIAIMLMLCFALTLCACGEEAVESNESSVAAVESSEASEVNESKEESVEIDEAEFKVTIVTADGTPVPGVMVQLCKDTCIPAKTGEDGVAIFKAEITDGYKLSVLSCPAGYIYEGDAEIYLESGITEYTVELSEGDAQ